MTLEFKQCSTCGGVTSFRNEECVNCRQIETINLNGACPAPGVMAKIATHLETYGKVTVICSSLADTPGGSAMLLGYEAAKTEYKNGCPILSEEDGGR